MPTQPHPDCIPGFALDQDGDELRLYNGAILLDSVTFGPQAPDLSISRTGAGLDVWALTAPTLGSSQRRSGCTRECERSADQRTLYKSGLSFGGRFREIYNPATQPVALGGVVVTDDSINYPAQFALPP
jgi:hypothetical protein